MSKMIDIIQKTFPMSKGAFLAVSLLGAGGVYQVSEMNSSMDEIKEIVKETRDDIHAIDKRLTVVEARLDGTIVFRSAQPEDYTAQVDSMYSNPETVEF